MRLLNTETRELEEYFDVDIPPYAILSHTWENDEVTFQDIQDGTFRRKAGFEKMENFRKLARSHGYDHVWIDTCCIDKSSSAELSEAINSMFRWYRKAKICYAYLVDIPSFDFSWSKFGDSRWFTRGWTLQELIAPLHVEFYSQDWCPLGSKLDLRLMISDITGIQARALEGARPHGFCVAQKMRWASKRNTTRIEDRAYSLLGIFDINMPLLYGEGMKSFTRLQEEIMKATHDHTLFAWTPRRNAYVGLLATSPDDFQTTSNIFPIRNEESLPYYSTNEGVRLQLPLMRFSDTRVPSKHAIALDCQRVHNKNGKISTSRFWIPLLPIDSNVSGASKFVRAGISSSFFEAPGDEQNCPLTVIYVKAHQPDAFRLLETTEVLVQISLSGCGFFLASKYPPEAWDDLDGQNKNLSISTLSITRSDAMQENIKSSNSQIKVLGSLLFRKSNHGGSSKRSFVLFIVLNESDQALLELRELNEKDAEPMWHQTVNFDKCTFRHAEITDETGAREIFAKLRSRKAFLDTAGDWVIELRDY